jgi:hypothetical protein
MSKVGRVCGVLFVALVFIYGAALCAAGFVTHDGFCATVGLGFAAGSGVLARLLELAW